MTGTPVYGTPMTGAQDRRDHDRHHRDRRDHDRHHRDRLNPDRLNPDRTYRNGITGTAQPDP